MVKKAAKNSKSKQSKSRNYNNGSSSSSSSNVKAGVAAIAGLCVIYFFASVQDTTNLSLAVVESNAAISGSVVKPASNNKRILPKPKTPTQTKKLRRQQHPEFQESWTMTQRIEAEQTGRVFPAGGPEKPPKPPQRETQFMKFHTDVSREEGYSGSWLQQKGEFLSMKLDDIQQWEDAAIFAYHDEPDDNRGEKMYMTLDLLDFSVEHLSTWWDILDIYENGIPYINGIQTLVDYIEKEPPNSETASDLEQTIAVIAFKEYLGVNSDSPPIDRRDTLNSLALAASMESIRRAGFGRVVVAGTSERDGELAQDAFRLLDPQQTSGPISKVGKMEVGFVQENAAADDRNVPKAALLGLRKAFDIAAKGAQSKDNSDYMTAWLGNTRHPEYWFYVYLTEADNILVHRQGALSKLREIVGNGGVLLPHQLLPIPHESDIEGARRRETFLLSKEPFNKVIELDGKTDTCCDENWGPQLSPGMPPYFDDCQKPWYECEFGNPELPVEDRPHERLRKYTLMRLTQGTGITLLAGTERGRRCSPEKENKGCVIKG